MATVNFCEHKLNIYFCAIFHLKYIHAYISDIIMYIFSLSLIMIKIIINDFLINGFSITYEIDRYYSIF